MSITGSFFPLIVWLFYPLILTRLERMRPSLSSLMAEHRLRWVRNAVSRDTPVDAILTSNLMGSISFFASTTVLLILALFTVYGQFGAVEQALDALRVGSPVGDFELEAELLALLAILTLGFLFFTLSLRQFNHFCILLGAAQPGSGDQREIAAIARLNTVAARNFTQGIRAYYFAIAGVAWFWSPYAAIAGTILIAALLMQREFYSPARTLAADLGKPERSNERKTNGQEDRPG